MKLPTVAGVHSESGILGAVGKAMLNRRMHPNRNAPRVVHSASALGIRSWVLMTLW